MSVCLPDIHETEDFVKQHLEKCFHLLSLMEPSQFFENLTDFEKQKFEIAVRELADIKSLYKTLRDYIVLPDDLEALIKKSQLTDQVARQLHLYLSEYGDILTEDDKSNLSESKLLLEIHALAYNGLYLLIRSTVEKSSLEQIKKYSSGVNCILKCVESACFISLKLKLMIFYFPIKLSLLSRVR
ncbi:MAG: hypothetical protein HC852_09095 [Acaryochloridaceae cyanobacterium RU_4_10]|nr:hypothetical protein [Acaryochloridaceae cyanobacterium RU_4_10]